MSFDETPELRRALFDFALASGFLILVEIDGDGIIRECNNGFNIAMRPTGEARGQRLSDYLSTTDGRALEIVSGLSDGTPVPNLLRSWAGQEVLLHTYTLAQGRMLLVGALTSLDQSQVTQQIARLNTDMSHLVRELKQANRRVLELAHTDVLTGLANRRHFMDRLRDALEQTRRNSEPLTLLMADLDKFKQINDHYGHAGGDDVLRAFAKLLRARARESDLAGRLGGEEFALMLPGVDIGEARQVAERVRGAMAALEPLGDGHRFTVSIGVAAVHDGEGEDLLLSRADDALYAAKCAGRDRVVVASYH